MTHCYNELVIVSALLSLWSLSPSESGLVIVDFHCVSVTQDVICHLQIVLYLIPTAMCTHILLSRACCVNLLNYNDCSDYNDNNA